jgi:hypothetical protein
VPEDASFDHIWYWKSRPIDNPRKGQKCRVLVRGAMNNVLVEFEDGYQVVTSRYAVRKAKAEP